MDVLRVKYSGSGAAKEFTRSIRETGFAVITDHPISSDLIFETYEDWSHFFKSPDKLKYKFNPVDQSGYFPFKSENAKDYSFKDLKEFYHYFPGSELPDGVGLKTVGLCQSLMQMASVLLGWIDDEAPESVRHRLSMPLRDMIVDSKRILFRIIHYPPLTGSEDPGEVRAAAHEDINLITLLPAATEPGLQVKDAKGQWHDVPCDPGNIVVNAGDMLQMATGGYYISTTHRVINPKGEALRRPRYSMPLFLHPRPDVKLSETHSADDYLNERLREIGLKAP